MTSQKVAAATLLVALPLVAAATAAMAEQTFITTNWVETKLSMNECLSRAADAIRGAGGWGKVLNTSDARHALRGMYTLQLRCVPEKDLLIIVVAGPSKATAKYADELVDHF